MAPPHVPFPCCACSLRYPPVDRPPPPSCQSCCEVLCCLAFSCTSLLSGPSDVAPAAPSCACLRPPLYHSSHSRPIGNEMNQRACMPPCYPLVNATPHTVQQGMGWEGRPVAPCRVQGATTVCGKMRGPQRLHHASPPRSVTRWAEPAVTSRATLCNAGIGGHSHLPGARWEPRSGSSASRAACRRYPLPMACLVQLDAPLSLHRHPHNCTVDLNDTGRSSAPSPVLTGPALAGVTPRPAQQRVYDSEQLPGSAGRGSRAVEQPRLPGRDQPQHLPRSGGGSEPGGSGRAPRDAGLPASPVQRQGAPLQAPLRALRAPPPAHSPWMARSKGWKPRRHAQGRAQAGGSGVRVLPRLPPAAPLTAPAAAVPAACRPSPVRHTVL